MAPLFVTTPWRDAEELRSLRGDLFAGGDVRARERGVGKILAWRARKLELPLLLDSTADIVEAQLQDAKATLPPHALTLLYAAALARFITGVLDTLPSPTTLPPSLRETRHRIVHRHIPSLGELQRAACESRSWLWENYWSRLYPRAAPPQVSEREIQEQIHATLKTYVKARKAEIKSRHKTSTASSKAARSLSLIPAPADRRTRILLDLLIHSKLILPAAKKGSLTLTATASMTGAHLIWTPLLTSLSLSSPFFLPALLDRLIAALSSTLSTDAEKKGLCAWIVHVATAPEWEDIRRGGDGGEGKVWDGVLGLCFTASTRWTLELAGELLRNGGVCVSARGAWFAVLDAARGGEGDDGEQGISPDREDDEEMDLDTDAATVPVAGARDGGEKISGPQRHVGFWRARPIGWVPPGWEEDE